ncbi:MAG: glycosyltransferase [Tyzzerella sp.]|nr:glycosyltransferase [Tyzzerella sp.]
MKIIYYYSQLNVGGAERSTVRLVNRMKDMGWDVTLLLRWNNGKLEHELDDEIKRIYLKYERKSAFAGRVGDFIWAIFQYIFCKIRERRLNKEEYDIAICGLFGYNPHILLRKVRARQYYQMLRNDVEKTGKYGKTEQYIKEFGDCFDRYIGVSSYTTESFKRCYPQYANKAKVIYNIIPEVNQDEQMNIPQEYTSAGERLKILTLGRLENRSKGLFRILDVVKMLVEDGFDNFIWYIVGEGPDREELSKRISNMGLDNVVMLCKGTTNPFPYYKYADLVAVLSYYEGLCGVVNEAKIMERPVIATNFSGIQEQLTDGENGYIVENDVNAIIEKMRKLLTEPSLIKKTAINGLPEKLKNNDLKIEEFKITFEEVVNEKA